MSDETPTVVLVHGAFADASNWNGVIERLQAKGVKVTAQRIRWAAIAHDSAYTASLFEQTPGPAAVGDSDGGAVIRMQRARAKNVVGLCGSSAAFALNKVKTLGQVEANSKDSVLNSALVTLKYLTADRTAIESHSIPTRSTTPSPPTSAGRAQRRRSPRPSVPWPRRRSLLAQRATSPAGGSWTVLATGDKAAGTDVIRSQADKRARHDNRGRRLPRDHDLPATGRDRRDHGGTCRGQDPGRGRR